jgi:hypothetical protein
MSKPNAFTPAPKVPRPEIITPQAWSDRRPRTSQLKTDTLAAVNKLVVFGKKQ